MKAPAATKKSLMTGLKTLKQGLKAPAITTSNLAEQLAAVRLQIEILERSAGSSNNTIEDPLTLEAELPVLAVAPGRRQRSCKMEEQGRS